MITGFMKTVTGAVLVATILQASACGTLMYPERRGQRAGEIDVKVAVFDGIGLFFFIIPGVVAYIVDFGTGAIYLPAGRRNRLKLEGANPVVVQVNPILLQNPGVVRRIVSEEMGLSGTVDWSKLQSSEINADRVATRLAETDAVGYSR